MPFKKGDPRPPGAGRKKGLGFQPARQILLERKVCPIRGMCDMLADPKTSEGAKVRLLIALAEYEHPRLRSTEVTGTGPGGSIAHSVTQDGESEKDSFARRIIDLAERARPKPDPVQHDGAASQGPEL